MFLKIFKAIELLIADISNSGIKPVLLSVSINAGRGKKDLRFFKNDLFSPSTNCVFAGGTKAAASDSSSISIISPYKNRDIKRNIIMHKVLNFLLNIYIIF